MTLATDYIAVDLPTKPRSNRGKGWFSRAHTKSNRRRDRNPESRRSNVDRGKVSYYPMTGGVTFESTEPVRPRGTDGVRVAYTTESRSYKLPVPVMGQLSPNVTEKHVDVFFRCVGTSCRRRLRYS